jgi:hypothetical protein
VESERVRIFNASPGDVNWIAVSRLCLEKLSQASRPAGDSFDVGCWGWLFDVHLLPNIALARTLPAKGVPVDFRNSEIFALGLTRGNRKGLSRHH